MLELKILYYNNKSIPDVEYSASGFFFYIIFTMRQKKKHVMSLYKYHGVKYIMSYLKRISTGMNDIQWENSSNNRITFEFPSGVMHQAGKSEIGYDKIHIDEMVQINTTINSNEILVSSIYINSKKITGEFSYGIIVKSRGNSNICGTCVFSYTDELEGTIVPEFDITVPGYYLILIDIYNYSFA